MENNTTSTDTNNDGVDLLLRLMNDAFDGNIDDLALAMGRPVEEIRAWMDGSEEMDEDAKMKVRGMIQQRLGDEVPDQDESSDQSTGGGNESMAAEADGRGL